MAEILDSVLIAVSTLAIDGPNKRQNLIGENSLTFVCGFVLCLKWMYVLNARCSAVHQLSRFIIKESIQNSILCSVLTVLIVTYIVSERNIFERKERFNGEHTELCRAVKHCKHSRELLSATNWICGRSEHCTEYRLNVWLVAICESSHPKHNYFQSLYALNWKL